MISLLFLELVFLAVFIASLACFELQTCAGGPGAAPAFEFVLFSNVVLRLAFYWMDTTQ